MSGCCSAVRLTRNPTGGRLFECIADVGDMAANLTEVAYQLVVSHAGGRPDLLTTADERTAVDASTDCLDADRHASMIHGGLDVPNAGGVNHPVMPWSVRGSERHRVAATYHRAPKHRRGSRYEEALF